MIVKEFKQYRNGLWSIKTEDNEVVRIAHKWDKLVIDRDNILYHDEYVGCDNISIEKVKEKLKFNGFIFPPEKIYEVDYKNFKDEKSAKEFQSWWINNGTEIETGESVEEFGLRVAMLVWNRK